MGTYKNNKIFILNDILLQTQTNGTKLKWQPRFLSEISLMM